jgi:hypothetical protein
MVLGLEEPNTCIPHMPGEDIDEASVSVMHQGDAGGKLGHVDWLYLALVLVMLAGLIFVWIVGVRVYVNNAGRLPHLTVPRSRRAKAITMRRSRLALPGIRRRPYSREL